MSRPKFSILIPTRDRPDLLRFALRSAKLQTWEDFELIVSDNFVKQPARAVFDEFADPRFKYVRPPEPLSMADNWEFASLQARGEYLTVLIDKTVLLPSTLQAAAEAVERKPADVISWWNEGFHLDREERGDFVHGRYAPGFAQLSATALPFDPQQELARRYRLDVRRGSEGVNYGYGKICFGAFRDTLMERIRSRFGRVFYPLCPDYTSMVLALATAELAIDLGRPGLMSINTVTVSNGARFAQDAGYARWFSSTSGPEYAPEHWPVPGLYASHHNIVAFDYSHIRALAQGLVASDLNLGNLLLRAREDLDAVEQWPDEPTRTQQYQAWQRTFETLPQTERARVAAAVDTRLSHERSVITRLKSLGSGFKARLKRVPGAAAAYRRLPGVSTPSREFEDVIDAARYADRHYYPESNEARR